MNGIKVYLAIDIGASSGRHIVGWQENGAIQTREVYRFPNGVKEENGHLVWDTAALVESVKQGIAAAKSEFPEIESLSIDTWGVDYVLLKGDEEVYPVYAYRDGRTEAVIPQVHEKVSFSELYRRTGCQFQPFNTIYQLYDEKVNGRLEGITDMLMMPEFLMWKLCSVKAKEQVIALPIEATALGNLKIQMEVQYISYAEAKSKYAATAEKMKEFRLVVWGMHGIYGTGKTMDETFGLIETVEKAAQIYMLTAHLPRINTIRDDQMVELAEFFGVKYRKDFLNL